MKHLKLFFFSSTFALAITACGGGADHNHEGHDHDDEATQTEATEAKPHGEGTQFTSAYVCPMHCEGSGGEEAGKCPVCGMDYVANAEHMKDGHTH